MKLNSFSFSQSSLQDFVDCPRRFELRYLLKQAWPAIQSEPVQEQEQRMEAGRRFHELVYQHQIGLPEQQLSASILEPTLRAWWENYLQDPILSQIPGLRKVEYELSAPFAGQRITAKYDLLGIEAGEKCVILDWKTGLRRPKSKTLRERIQSRLYPFLLVEAGAFLNHGNPFLAEQIEMIYWFTEAPQEPEHIYYDSKKFQIDREDLGSLIKQIETLEKGQFPLTSHENACKFCEYRSLCDRGVNAGDFSEAEENQVGETGDQINSIQIDFDQIGEIAF